MKKMILTALILATFSVSDAQVRENMEGIFEVDTNEFRNELIRGIRNVTRESNQIPEHEREVFLDEVRREEDFMVFTPPRRDDIVGRRAFVEFVRDIANELSNEEREIAAEIYRDVPELVEIFRENTGVWSWIGNNPGKVAISATAMVLTGLAVYHRNKISEVGKQAIAWMKKNKGISIAIITSIILSSYGMCLFTKWNLDNDTDKSFGDNFTAANGKLWHDTAGNAWTFTTEHPWFVGITLGGMAVAGTAGYLLSKKAATAMYDEITGQHDDNNLAVS